MAAAEHHREQPEIEYTRNDLRQGLLRALEPVVLAAYVAAVKQANGLVEAHRQVRELSANLERPGGGPGPAEVAGHPSLAAVTDEAETTPGPQHIGARPQQIEKLHHLVPAGGVAGSRLVHPAGPDVALRRTVCPEVSAHVPTSSPSHGTGTRADLTADRR